MVAACAAGLLAGAGGSGSDWGCGPCRFGRSDRDGDRNTNNRSQRAVGALGPAGTFQIVWYRNIGSGWR